MIECNKTLNITLSSIDKNTTQTIPDKYKKITFFTSLLKFKISYFLTGETFKRRQVCSQTEEVKLKTKFVL